MNNFDLEKALSTQEGKIALGIKTVLFIVVIVIAIILMKKLINLIAPGTSDYRREVKRNNLSFSESEYRTMADTLFRACNGWGTEESVVYRTLGYLKTIDDWKKLVSVYGTDKDNFLLPGRLIYELDRKEQSKVNSILNKIGARI